MLSVRAQRCQSHYFSTTPRILQPPGSKLGQNMNYPQPPQENVEILYRSDQSPINLLSIVLPPTLCYWSRKITHNTVFSTCHLPGPMKPPYRWWLIISEPTVNVRRLLVSNTLWNTSNKNYNLKTWWFISMQHENVFRTQNKLNDGIPQHENDELQLLEVWMNREWSVR